MHRSTLTSEAGSSAVEEELIPYKESVVARVEQQTKLLGDLISQKSTNAWRENHSTTAEVKGQVVHFDGIKVVMGAAKADPDDCPQQLTFASGHVVEVSKRQTFWKSLAEAFPHDD